MTDVVTLVGHSARDAYREEAGYRPLGAPAQPSRALSASQLRMMITEARTLVGPHAFDACQAKHRKGQASPTPPAQPHRLMMLADYVLETARKMEAPRPWQMPVWPIVELQTILAVLQRWQTHAAWSGLVSALPTEFEHTVAHLVMASYLVDAGNGVGIGKPEGMVGVKVPDMWVQADVSKRLDLEVKTPVSLRGPRSAVSREEAARMLKHHLKRTVSGGSQQLSGRDGILALCGFSLESPDLDVLEATAQSLLASRAQRHTRFVGIVVATIGFTAEEHGREITGSMDTRLVIHPGYKGTLKIDQRQPDGRVSQAFDVP